MRLKAEIKFTNTKKCINELAEVIRPIAEKGVNGALLRYSKKKNYGWIEEVITQDIITEYVKALISYDYSGAKKREDMTELIMRADGRDPNPQGSYKREDAITWARKSTKTKTKVKTRKKRAMMKDRRWVRKGLYINSLIFRIHGEVRNRILANLEEGIVSWVGDPKKIAGMIKTIANKGYEAGRITEKERNEMRLYASTPNLFRKETSERKYFDTSLKKATEKYGNKWIDIIRDDLRKHISKTTLPKVRMVIPRDNIKVKTRDLCHRTSFRWPPNVLAMKQKNKGDKT